MKMVMMAMLTASTLFAGETSTTCNNDKVIRVWIQGDGAIMFQTQKKCPSAACSISDGWNSDTKKQAFALLLTAKETGDYVTLDFNSNVGGCTAWQGGTRWDLPVPKLRIGQDD